MIGFVESSPLLLSPLVKHVADEMFEYEEPNNTQLARFLVIYAEGIPGMESLQLSAPTLELLMTNNPDFRAGALRHHKAFQEEIHKHSRKLEAGTLQCEHIRPNKKRCPNHNEPGSYYCGLHKPEDSI